MKTVTFITIALLLGWGNMAIGQESREDSMTKIQDSLAADHFNCKLPVLSRVYSDSIVLRWAPENSGAWALLNTYGYKIERADLGRDSSNIDATFKALHQGALKPYPVSKWKSLHKKYKDDDMVLVGVEVVHGKITTTGPGLLGMVEASDQLSNKHALGLMAADLSPRAAKGMALRWGDQNVRSGEVYIYRISPLVPPGQYVIDTGYVMVRAGKIEKYPAPILDVAEGKEKQVDLVWNRPLHEQFFSAYYIESSVNGSNFVRENELPFASPLDDDGVMDPTTITYPVKQERNYEKKFYRIIGVTPFGEESPPSNVLKGMGRDKTPPLKPMNVRAEEIRKETIEVQWEWEGDASELEGFYIGRSSSAYGRFEPLTETPLPAGTRNFVDKNPNRGMPNYYMVAASDTAKNGSTSMAAWGLIQDSFPPTAPTGLQATVDTNGIVTLTWNANPETDLLGYQVFYANKADHVFTIRTNRPFKETTFTDTIMVKTLTEKIYYKVMAVDFNFNYSELSQVLELKRPDLIPPTPPVFKPYKVREEGITLRWAGSNSKDLVSYELHRKTRNSTWRNVKTWTGTLAHSYKDTDIAPDKWYEYRIFAVDDAGNRSKAAFDMVIKSKPNVMIGGIDQIRVSPAIQKGGVEVSWNVSYSRSRFVHLYRREAGGKWLLIKSVPTTERSYRDSLAKKGKSYEYRVRVVTRQGDESAFSKVESISF